MHFFRLLVVWLAALFTVQAAELLDFGKVEDVIPNAYIVVMKNEVSSNDFSSHVTWLKKTHRRNLAKRGSTFTEGLRSTWDIDGWQAYSGKFGEDTLQDILTRENVDFVEPNRRVQASSHIVQSNVTWGLARISHKKNNSTDYVSNNGEGEGITFYGVDSGIDIDHPEFGGRVRWGINLVDTTDADCYGHGTHTAGTAAGKRFGILKKASIVSVKVLDCYGVGDVEGVVNGVIWAAKDAREKGTLGKSVMNVSIGGPRSKAVNEAMVRAQEAGIFISVSAGNEARNASMVSPASAPELCTVAASTTNDTKAFFSNYGEVVDLFAPGVNVISALPGRRMGPMSGTSMSSPHVCGVGGLLMATEGLAPGEVCDRLKEMASPVMKERGIRTTNKLLYNGSGA
ncbi:alkaline serine protease [Arthroderma uncinatum]|uniref:alkaline serine protease n=1 Tax=Arthroderma uncinatum TaxID=74035 RepID=UPI00144AACDB|nr:alkaline serine protease [Arthroderma uncinatum]KAF3482054.1 alkaline serine protease [Arthroderma uncinatum]